jgi:hypothetical protein
VVAVALAPVPTTTAPAVEATATATRPPPQTRTLTSLTPLPHAAAGVEDVQRHSTQPTSPLAVCPRALPHYWYSLMQVLWAKE